MNARIWRSLMILVVCLGLPAGYALAQNRDQGKDRDRDKHEARERQEHKEARESREARLRHEREEAREARLRHEREERERHRRHEREEAREHHIHQGPGHVSPTSTTGTHQPPGWNKGKKTGWGHCDVPPGHAKPADCK